MSKEHCLLVFLTNTSLRRTSSWGNSTSRLRRLAMHLVQVGSIHFHSWNIFRWAFTNALKVRLRSNKEASLALHPRTQTDVRKRNHSPCTRCQISYLLGSKYKHRVLIWSLLYLASSLDVQAEIHRELDDVIGLNHQPCLQDKRSLPYLKATTMEVMRNSSRVFVTFPHRVLSDTTLRD